MFQENKMKILTVILLAFSLSGCAVHFQNQKGIKIKGKDFQTRIGTVDKGKAHYWSELEIWFPWKMVDE